jgi:hypothetical protein
MKWEKLGLIYTPRFIHPKLASHAANPLPVHLEGDVYRIFFNGRDTQNKSSIGYADINIKKRQLLNICDSPAFEYGPEGSFYQYGASIGSCYKTDDQTYMLFMGWQHLPGGHWRGDIGRLIVGQDYSLRLDRNAPFLGATTADPISISYPYAMRTDSRYEMWYGSTITWDAGNGEMIHSINHAISTDGNHWERKGLAIPYQLGIAQAFSRPTVIRHDDNSYEMWFSYRGSAGQSYRIGYARKTPDAQWELCLNETGIDVSSSGWDSEMIEYPYVFDHAGCRYMLYCGNGYGKSGFGLAILKS